MVKAHTEKLTPEIIKTLRDNGKKTIRINKQTGSLSKPLNKIKIKKEYYDKIAIKDE